MEAAIVSIDPPIRSIAGSNTSIEAAMGDEMGRIELIRPAIHTKTVSKRSIALAIDGYSTTTSFAPASTATFSATRSSLTTPSLAARSSFSIFMASTTTRPSPALTA
jgi:hypothetical protein